MNKYIIFFNNNDYLIEFLNNHKQFDVSLIDIICNIPLPKKYTILSSNIASQHNKVSLVAFVCGLLGMILSIIMIFLIEGTDYKLNLGGKPFFTIISSVPVIFVITILFSSIGVIAFLFLKIKSSSFDFTNKYINLGLGVYNSACIFESLTINDEMLIDKLQIAFNIVKFKKLI